MHTVIVRRHVPPGEVAALVMVLGASVLGLGTEMCRFAGSGGPDGSPALVQPVYWLLLVGLLGVVGVWLMRLRERSVLELDLDEGLLRVREQRPLRKPTERSYPWDDAAAVAVDHPEGDEPSAALVLRRGEGAGEVICQVSRAEAKSIADRLNRAALHARQQRDEEQFRAEVRARSRSRRRGSKPRA